jgi:hypothetical protein
MNAGSARLLILVNAFAAAASFVGAWFVADLMPGLLAPEIIVLGLVGVAYFTRKAENQRRALRKPGGVDNS